MLSADRGAHRLHLMGREIPALTHPHERFRRVKQRPAQQDQHIVCADGDRRGVQVALGFGDDGNNRDGSVGFSERADQRQRLRLGPRVRDHQRVVPASPDLLLDVRGGPDRRELDLSRQRGQLLQGRGVTLCRGAGEIKQPRRRREGRTVTAEGPSDFVHFCQRHANEVPEHPRRGAGFLMIPARDPSHLNVGAGPSEARGSKRMCSSYRIRLRHVSSSFTHGPDAARGLCTILHGESASAPECLNRCNLDQRGDRAFGVRQLPPRKESRMTWKDKLEIGLKDDAPYRRDNLPEEQVRGPEKPKGPGRSPEVPRARDEENAPPEQPGARRPSASGPGRRARTKR